MGTISNTVRKISRVVKLARALGWEPETVARSFTLVEVRLGEVLRHYGLEIEPHVTVHSIPTIGVTVRANRMGRSYRICVVGDNQSFDEISEMRRAGMLRESTEQKQFLINLSALRHPPGKPALQKERRRAYRFGDCRPDGLGKTRRPKQPNERN